MAARAGDIPVIIPPHVTAVLSDDAGHSPSQRDKHITLMREKGRLGWQKEANYGRRSLVETTAVGVAVLNRMLHAGQPNSVRCSQSAS